MLPPLLLVGIVSLGTMLIQLAAFALHYWHTRGRYRKQIVAMIEQVQIWVDGWYVTSVWTDALTGQHNLAASGPRPGQNHSHSWGSWPD